MCDTQPTPRPRLSKQDLDEMAQSGSVRLVNAVIEIQHLETENAALLSACKLLMRRLEVNELVGLTDSLGKSDQAAYDSGAAAIAKAKPEQRKEGTDACTEKKEG